MDSIPSPLIRCSFVEVRSNCCQLPWSISKVPFLLFQQKHRAHSKVFPSKWMPFISVKLPPTAETHLWALLLNPPGADSQCTECHQCQLAAESLGGLNQLLLLSVFLLRALPWLPGSFCLYMTLYECCEFCCLCVRMFRAAQCSCIHCCHCALWPARGSGALEDALCVAFCFRSPFKTWCYVVFLVLKAEPPSDYSYLDVPVSLGVPRVRVLLNGSVDV